MAGDASAPPAIERVLEAAAAGAQASCYQVLGLAASAAAGDVRRAYLSLALQVHPDKHNGDERAAQAFVAVFEAFETLSDPAARARHDILLQQTLHAQTLHTGPPGGGARGARSEAGRGAGRGQAAASADSRGFRDEGSDARGFGCDSGGVGPKAEGAGRPGAQPAFPNAFSSRGAAPRAPGGGASSGGGWCPGRTPTPQPGGSSAQPRHSGGAKSGGAAAEGAWRKGGSFDDRLREAAARWKTEFAATHRVEHSAALVGELSRRNVPDSAIGEMLRSASIGGTHPATQDLAALEAGDRMTMLSLDPPKDLSREPPRGGRGRKGGADELPTQGWTVSKGAVFVWVPRLAPRILHWRAAGGGGSAEPDGGIVLGGSVRVAKLKGEGDACFSVASPHGGVKLRASGAQAREVWVQGLRSLTGADP